MICNLPLMSPEEEKVTLTLTGTGDTSYCYVIINNEKYTAGATIQVDPGTNVLCYTIGPPYGGVYLNGVDTGSGTYSYSAEKGATISMYSDNAQFKFYIYITEN